MAGTLTCPTPDNMNPLSPNGFQFSIQKLPDLNFFAQEVNLPGITLGAPELANPFALQPLPGDVLTYDQLNVRFLVDEDMDNYTGIYNWIVALGFPEDYNQYINFKNNDTRELTNELAQNYSDATLAILGSNNQIVKTIQFIDLFPLSIGSLVFMSTNTDVQYLVGDATFRFGYYRFV